MIGFYESILEQIPPTLWDNIWFVILPFITLILAGVMAYLKQAILSFVLGFITVSAWFLVITDQVVKAYYNTQSSLGFIAGTMEIVPIIFLTAGIMCITSLALISRRQVNINKVILEE